MQSGGILDEHIKPDIMISGHMHDTRVDFSDKIHDERESNIDCYWFNHFK